MEYKNTYTIEEVEELYKWFDTHDYPSEIDLGHGVVVKDTKMLVNKSKTIALRKYDNPTFSGQINFLYLVRDEIIRLESQK